MLNPYNQNLTNLESRFGTGLRSANASRYLAEKAFIKRQRRDAVAFAILSVLGIGAMIYLVMSPPV